MYDELMKTLQINKVYPLEGPLLKTKPNKQGNTYKFQVSHVSIISRNIVRVHGQSAGVWCRLEYNFKSLPKWLKQGLKNL